MNGGGGVVTVSVSQGACPRRPRAGPSPWPAAGAGIKAETRQALMAGRGGQQEGAPRRRPRALPSLRVCARRPAPPALWPPTARARAGGPKQPPTAETVSLAAWASQPARPPASPAAPRLMEAKRTLIRLGRVAWPWATRRGGRRPQGGPAALPSLAGEGEGTAQPRGRESPGLSRVGSSGPLVVPAPARPAARPGAPPPALPVQPAWLPPGGGGNREGGRCRPG